MSHHLCLISSFLVHIFLSLLLYSVICVTLHHMLALPPPFVSLPVSLHLASLSSWISLAVSLFPVQARTPYSREVSLA